MKIQLTIIAGLAVLNSFGADIQIPKEWEPPTPIIETPKDPGVIKLGISPDGKRGVMLSKLEINPESFKNLENPLAELGWIITEADKKAGYNVISEREINTSVGKARVILSQKKEYLEVIQTFIFLEKNNGIFVRLLAKSLDTNINPNKDPELGKIIKSLKFETQPQKTEASKP